jgi:CheY-like chemotaxis protein
METIRLSLPTSPVRWGLRCQDQPWIVLADESQLGQVVQNLVVNACQWQPTDPQIEVAVSNRVLQAHEHPVLAAGSFVQVDFRDRGPGIAQAIRGRIFDTYFSTRTDGSGLGLAICRSILIHHGGFIECVESTTGAHFRVLLPAVDISVEDAAPPKLPIARPRMSRRILVMDDEPAMREMVQDILESQGCEVVTAGDGKDAAKCWLSARSAGRPFDLALLDLTVTSGWGGLEASRRILLEDPSARLVICSGYADDPVVLAAADQGFRGSLSKPFRMAELLEMVDRVLSA